MLVLVRTSLRHVGNQSGGSLRGTEPALDASVAEGFAELCRQRTVQNLDTVPKAGCPVTAGINDFCRPELA